jgi:hypothetical protein
MLKAASCLPLETSPVMRGKLLNGALGLSFDSLDMSEVASPGIVLYFEILACLHAKINTEPVAGQNIQDPL